ncbi:acidic leucine-rich nuclear phosphoprotein 32-related protein [Clonorchis sinensis]|uniref:Acidic leucine-rich nuclear phosphoprotein 32-related protein n=1 Tax=Clonorchis sinensis TaxID=79923 RepID=G7YPT2_CLOSI|nr:acidic leucine-rich nuclear phosphoprotein 32-related protein [Clonorchis sinensis]
MTFMTLPQRIELEQGKKAPSEIKELTLSHSKSTVIEGLSDEFTNLEVLNLVSVGLEDLSGLPKLPSLKILDLSNNAISGGLEALLNCPNLETLNLSANKVATIDALLPLAKLSCLSSIDLFNCEVTGLENYRKTVFAALPNLKYLDGLDDCVFSAFRTGNESPCGGRTRSRIVVCSLGYLKSDAEVANGDEKADDDEEKDSDDDEEEEEEYGIEALQRSGDLEDDDEDYAPGVTGPRRPGSKRRRSDLAPVADDDLDDEAPVIKHKATEETEGHVNNGATLERNYRPFDDYRGVQRSGREATDWKLRHYSVFAYPGEVAPPARVQKLLCCVSHSYRFKLTDVGDTTGFYANKSTWWFWLRTSGDARTATAGYVGVGIVVSDRADWIIISDRNISVDTDASLPYNHKWSLTFPPEAIISGEVCEDLCDKISAFVDRESGQRWIIAGQDKTNQYISFIVPRSELWISEARGENTAIKPPASAGRIGIITSERQFDWFAVIAESVRRTLDDVQIVAGESIVDLEYADDIFKDQSEAQALLNRLTTIIPSFGMRLAKSCFRTYSLRTYPLQFKENH